IFHIHLVTNLDVVDDVSKFCYSEAGYRNLMVTTHFLPMKFGNLGTSLLEFSFQSVKVLLDDYSTLSKTFYPVFYVLDAVKRKFI
nr:hypothetical protein [Tanacetum cinerariifolium]